MKIVCLLGCIANCYPLIGSCVNDSPLEKDIITEPRLIVANEEGMLELESYYGCGIGSSINYMPEWKAFGWFRSGYQDEWEVEVPVARKYIVFLEWSAEGGVVGNPNIFSTVNKKISGKIRTPGSWERFKEERIGVIKLRKGKQTMSF